MDPKKVEIPLEVHCPRCWPLPLTASAAPQAFRHLYVLAVEHRCLETVDTLTRQPCAVPVQIQLHSCPLHRATTLHTTTPCILPELSRVARVSVASPRYWSVTWSVNDAPPPPVGADAQQVGPCSERKSPYVDPAARRGDGCQRLHILSCAPPPSPLCLRDGRQ
jgi:hypothetical protein